MRITNRIFCDFYRKNGVKIYCLHKKPPDKFRAEKILRLILNIRGILFC